ncbi:ABC transporter ATP-binding protein [Lichenicoccus roseus]|uniref:ABC transporter ATP-binding protein n=1 Tax=Lichenicoccus roseus TaxID=2683649 RepID=A0A5R9J8Q9_9PROT|nr:ABC transporter ATP-binding protein [Lichenicoccus roseus]TLU71961.1 ABC transporter ATP-binding protein [Lichenicoccus roseus]
MTPIIEARSLGKHYRVAGGGLFGQSRRTLRALDNVSLHVMPGETLGIVGESGCGKSTLGRCLLRLTQSSSGRVLFEGEDITTRSERALRRLRPRMQMVFQDSYASLNPRRRIADLLSEPMRVHRQPSGAPHDRSFIAQRLRDLLDLTGLPISALDRYPHEFSGGQRQRINIARALALQPSLIVADEPVSALDVSIQAQIINLFTDLRETLGLTYIFIAHDLSVVRQIASSVAVMYLGAIVERGGTDSVLHAPAHPYTAALITAVPEPVVSAGARSRVILKGDVPSPVSPPPGCRFHTRCPKAEARCSVEIPALRPLVPAPDEALHEVACHYPLHPASNVPDRYATG